jgi:membrane glycosyltransferase
MSANEKDAWFVYQRRVGELSAQPANAKGWFALIGCILGTIAIALLTFFVLMPVSPVVAGIAMGAAIVAGVSGTVWLSVAKGRRVN